MANTTKFDVIVTGAGPAGLMAAIQAGRAGSRTLLFEKKNLPGRKLLITGNGRCNFTNMKPLREFLESFRPNGRFLRYTFSQFFALSFLPFLKNLA